MVSIARCRSTRPLMNLPVSDRDSPVPAPRPVSAHCSSARLVFPAQFNDLVERYGSKGAALSHVTVGLLREVMDMVAYDPSVPPPIYALCDKHGGRNFYTALLQHHFSEHWIEPAFESHAESRYEWGPSESRIRVTFRMQGERFCPPHWHR